MSSAQKLQQESNELQKLQTSMQEWVKSRQQLETQLQENKAVKEEFDQLGDDSKIYKLIGPVLVPQEYTEANTNVDKRLEFIQNEIKRTESNIESEKKKIAEKNQVVTQLRTELGSQTQQAST